MSLGPNAKAKAKVKRFVVFAMVPVWLSVGCAGPEQELLDRYLEASQRGDNETVAALSMVAFPEDVESWNFLEISDERRDPYLVPELRQIMVTAEDERDAQFAVFGEFRRKNYETLRRIRMRVSAEPDYHFPGRNGELQDQWEVFRLERRQVVAKLHQAETALEWELRRVNKSLQRESSPEYLTGVALRKDARVRVTTAAGDDGHYIITVTQYELKNQFDALVPARWIITEVAKAD